MTSQRIRSSLIAVLGAALVLVPQAVQAQQPDEAALLRRRVVLLEDRVVQLERQIARLEQLLAGQREPGMAGRAPVGPAALPVPFRPEGWRYPEAWRRLRRGYSELDVRHLLGQPGRIAAGETETVWFYPGGGMVRFSSVGERVEGWREP